MRRRLLCHAPLLAGALSGCDLLPTECTTELETRLTPAERTIRVGETFGASLELRGCGGRKRWRPDVVWRTTDTLVVRVDSASGHITGRAPGEARVAPVERRVNGERPYRPLLVRVR